jgi:hypothetical protein
MVPLEMIPTAVDSDLAQISSAADLVLLKCRVMRNAARGDLPRLRAELRILLQQYVEKAMSFADGVNVQ